MVAKLPRVGYQQKVVQEEWWHKVEKEEKEKQGKAAERQPFHTTLSLHQHGLVAEQVSFRYFMPKSGIHPNSLHAIDIFW